MLIKMSESSVIIYLLVIFYSTGNMAVGDEAAQVIVFRTFNNSYNKFYCNNGNKSYSIEGNEPVSVKVSSKFNLTVDECLMKNTTFNYSAPYYHDRFEIDIYNVTKINEILSCSFLDVGETNIKRKVLCSVPLRFKDVDNTPAIKTINHTISYYLTPRFHNESLIETYENTFMAFVECYCDNSEANVTYDDCKLQCKDNDDSLLSMTRVYTTNSSNEKCKCTRENGRETATLNIYNTNQYSVRTKDDNSTYPYNNLNNNQITWIIVASVFCLFLLTTIGYFITKRLWKQCRERAAARLKRNQVTSDGSRPRLPTPIYEQPYDISTGYEDRIRRLKVSILLGKNNSGRPSSSSDPVPSGTNKKLMKKPRIPPPSVTYRPRIPTPPQRQVPQ